MEEKIEGVNFWEKGFRICPDCGGDKFLKGPEGGNCINFKCANPECGSEFNDMWVFGFERISEPQPDKKDMELGT